jgi:hypothetical protein
LLRWAQSGEPEDAASWATDTSDGDTEDDDHSDPEGIHPEEDHSDPEGDDESDYESDANRWRDIPEPLPALLPGQDGPEDLPPEDIPDPAERTPDPEEIRCPEPIRPYRYPKAVNEAISRVGASLPKPSLASYLSQRIHVHPVMSVFIENFLQYGLIVEWPIKCSFRCHVIPKREGGFRFIQDLSPWTPYYVTPKFSLLGPAKAIAHIPQHS